jgi:transposase
MGRQRTRLELTSVQKAKLEKLLATTRDARLRDRLHFAAKAMTGCDTLEELAHKIGRSRSTIQNWLAKFEAGGLDGLLERDTPPGMDSPLADEAIQKQLRDGIKSGHWKSATEVAAWLSKRHGIQRSRKSIYYWLTRSKLRRKKSKIGRPPTH